jgi:hypothetical protein
LLPKLEPKYQTQLYGYLEFLIFLQQKETSIKSAKKKTIEKGNLRLNALKQFKGDAPFPNFELSKYDVYEQ